MKTLLLAILAWCVSSFVNDFLTEDDRARFLKIITSSQDPDSYLLENSLTSTVYGLEALKLLGRDFPDSAKLCAALGRSRPKKEDIYQWLIIVGRLECPTNLPANFEAKLQKALEKPRFNTLFMASQASLALIDAGKLDLESISFSSVSTVLARLLDDKGFVQETPKDNGGSAYKTAQALALFSTLYSRYPEFDTQGTAEQLKTTIPELLKAGKKTGGQLIFQGSLTATVSVIAGIFQFSSTYDVPIDWDVASVNWLGKYVVANKFAETVTGARMVLTGIKYLANNPVHQPVAVKLVNPELSLSKNDGKMFTVTLQTLNGDIVTPDSLKVSSLTDVSVERKLMGESDLTEENGTFSLDLRNTITSPGLYELKLDLAHNEEKAGITRHIRAVAAMGEVKAMVFDFNKRQGVSKVPEDDKTRLVYPKTERKTYSVTGAREVRLEVVTKGMKPEQVSAVFKREGSCNIYELCTFTVPATPKSRKFQWRIDLSKQYYDQMTDGKYSLTVIVAGLFLDSAIEWHIGTIDVQVPSDEDMIEKDYEPVDDPKSYFHPREPIAHTFSPPPQQPNSLLATIFTAVVLAPLGGFVLFRDSFTGPSTFDIGSRGSYNLLFQLSLVMTLTLCVFYFLVLNIFQAATLLLVAFVCTFSTGFQLMKHLNCEGILRKRRS